MTEQSNDFWMTVAQVIPVLALALVLEARFLARRWSKKKAYKDRRGRRLWAATAWVVTLLLTSSEAWALGEIARPFHDSPINEGLDQVLSFWTVILIAISMLLVVSIPLGNITALALASPRVKKPSKWAQRRFARRVWRLKTDILVAKVQAYNGLFDIEAQQKELRQDMAEVQSRPDFPEALQEFGEPIVEKFQEVDQEATKAIEQLRGQIKFLNEQAEAVDAIDGPLRGPSVDLDEFERRIRKLLAEQA